MSKQIKDKIEELESDIKDKADEFHFHKVLVGWLIILTVIIIVILIATYYKSSPNIDSCLDRIANNYCIKNNMTFDKGNYGHYVLADDNMGGGGDFTCLDSNLDKHIIGRDNIKVFRFTMEEAKSCGYKQ